VIRYLQGDLLLADADALVNPVNTVGTMGKGLALQFKRAFPENYKLYRIACSREGVKVGRMFSTLFPTPAGMKWIVNFPTKQHWKDPSRLEWITAGLVDLRRFIKDVQIFSIAIPALGCGEGGLPWPSVLSEIIESLEDLPCDIQVFEPI
jgi:O-acetyl-ADP-ribose deacetylase (regulator of RNase III)